jgi:hypothetical protein
MRCASSAACRAIHPAPSAICIAISLSVRKDERVARVTQ